MTNAITNKLANSHEDLVSIILPTYKRAEKLERAIDSLLAQTYENIEIIVVDDNGLGSKDQTTTEKRLANYKNNKKINYVISKNNQGGSGARNLGFKHSNGKYIAFLDDDDEYKKENIEKRIKPFLQNKSINLVTSDMEIYDDNIERFIEKHYQNFKGNTLEEFLVSGIAFTPMLMIKREVFSSVGGFSKTPKFQDHILMLKILSKKNTIYSLREKLFIHHTHSGNRITSWDNYIQGWSVRRSYEKKHIHNLPPP